MLLPLVLLLLVLLLLLLMLLLAVARAVVVVVWRSNQSRLESTDNKSNNNNNNSSNSNSNQQERQQQQSLWMWMWMWQQQQQQRLADCHVNGGCGNGCPTDLHTHKRTHTFGEELNDAAQACCQWAVGGWVVGRRDWWRAGCGKCQAAQATSRIDVPPLGRTA